MARARGCAGEALWRQRNGRYRRGVPSALLIYPVPEVLNGSTQRRRGGPVAVAVTTSLLPPPPVIHASHDRLPDRMTGPEGQPRWLVSS
jgi:hypothetical protein